MPFQSSAEKYICMLYVKRNKALVTELSEPTPGSKELHFPTQYAQPFYVQCKACLWKQHWSCWRNPPYTNVHYILSFDVWDNVLGPGIQNVSYYCLMYSN